MTGIIAGLIAVLLVVGFLGGTAWIIGSVPLWIVSIFGMALMVAEYIEFVREIRAAGRPKMAEGGETPEFFVHRQT